MLPMFTALSIESAAAIFTRLIVVIYGLKSFVTIAFKYVLLSFLTYLYLPLPMG